MDNGIHLTGNLTRDPELRFSNSGTASTSFGLAINNRRKNASTGEWEDSDPGFYDVTCFGTLAENVAESLERGTRVTLNGKIDYQSWKRTDRSAARWLSSPTPLAPTCVGQRARLSARSRRNCALHKPRQAG